MGLDAALANAISGIQSAQTQIQVLSGNITNAQTPGYSREILPQQSQTIPSGGGGVITGTITRLTDQLLSGNLLAQTTASSAATTRNDYYTQIQNLQGQVNGGNTLNDALSAFNAAMQTVSTTPEDPLAQQNAVATGQALAHQLNTLSSGIQSLREHADGDIASAVGTLNTALTNIASLNVQIAKDKANGRSTATLEDQRDQALNQVAQLIGVQSFTRSDGTMVVMTSNGQLLADDTARQFSYTASGTINAGSVLSPLTLDGIDVTSETTTGKIGALLQLQRTDLPGLTAELNQFTNNLFNLAATPNLNTTNSGLGATNDAHHVFAAVDIAGGLDNSATIQVNPSLVANPDLLHTGTGGPDPTISSNLVANLASTATFAPAGVFTAPITTTLGDYASKVLAQSATAAAAATSDATFQSQLQTQLSNQLSAATGVNIDQELSNLVVYQNAYSASARVITTVQKMFDALMSA